MNNLLYTISAIFQLAFKPLLLLVGVISAVFFWEKSRRSVGFLTNEEKQRQLRKVLRFQYISSALFFAPWVIALLFGGSEGGGEVYLLLGTPIMLPALAIFIQQSWKRYFISHQLGSQISEKNE